MTIEIGDYVRVIDYIPSDHDCGVEWVHAMSEYMGSEGQVVSVDDCYHRQLDEYVDTYRLVFSDGEMYWFNANWIEGYEDNLNEDKTSIICNKVKQMYKRRQENGYAF